MFGHMKIRPLVLMERIPDAGPNRGRSIWTFVGAVPAELAYSCSANDPATVADLYRTAALCGPGLAIRGAERIGVVFATRYWHSEAEALAAAEALGAKVTQVSPAVPARSAVA